MLRSRRRTFNGPACLLTLAAMGAAATLPRAAATDQAFQSRSTLAPTVAPQNLTLDAAIASMVKRRLIADVPQQPKTSAAKPAAPVAKPSVKPVAKPTLPPLDDANDWSAQQPATVAAKPATAPSQPALIAIKPSTVAPRSTPGWRPVGQAAAAPTLRAAEIAAEPQFPTLPSAEPVQPPVASPRLEPAVVDPTPDDITPTEEDAVEAPPSDEASDSDATIELESDSEDPEALTDGDAPPADEADESAAAEDDLAPIDEPSETPAPQHDAPGDPLEPEYTGPALAPLDGSGVGADAAKPLKGTGKLTDDAALPLGEPDRLAKPDENLAPSNPEDFEEIEEPTTRSGKLRPMTRNQRALRDKVRNVLKYYYARPLNTGDRSPWEVMHMMLAYEVHSHIRQGGPQGEPITAVGWLCFNQPCKNRSLMYLNEDGDLRVKVGPALQGHHGQLLALLAQARVKSDYPMKVDGQDFTIVDLIEMEKSTCYPKTELTFKLIGLQRYLDINAKWVNDQGMQWDFPTLVREEMRQPVRTAACGGTHRLSGLTLAVKKRRNSGLPVNGEYAQAQQFVANYQNYAYRLQNPDGSFSTDWFKGPGAEPDIDRRLKTTGHTLEWLLYAASEEQLTYHRTVRAVNYLANIMHANRTREWEAGPLGHAIHALVLYDRLVFAKYDKLPAAESQPVAQRSQKHQQRRTKR